MKQQQKAPLSSDTIFQVSKTTSKHTTNIQESPFQKKIRSGQREAKFSVYL